MKRVILNGITWGHSRGITPLLAISQRYSELNPGIEIRWKKRSLQEFADFPLEKLTADYDLLVIDHPWVGRAAAINCILPLDKFIAPVFMADQAAHSVGKSHYSYQYQERQWALAIDAATPVASWRPDLLEKEGWGLPETWENLLELAAKDKVAVPAIPIDLLMNFYTFCLAHGKEPFTSEKEIIDEETGILAIETMKQLYSLVDKSMFANNPIAVAELMTATNKYWYCPFAYGYSNYSRKGYAKNRLQYGGPVSYKGSQLRTTIGGTGLAVSASSAHIDTAVDFAKLVASGECQQTLYVQNGGQPGHRAAWLNETANAITNNFFKNILPVMDNGYMRPRYNGYLYFQDHAGEPLQQCLMTNGDAAKTLEQMNKLYRESLSLEKSVAV